MKWKVKFAVIALAVFTAFPSWAEVVEVTGRLNPDMDEFVFALDGYEDESEMWRTKAITVKEGGKDIQTIAVSEFNDGEDASAPGKDTLLIEDLNFDGFADIRLQAMLPAGSSVPYICWLWDDGTRQFVHSPELSAIPSIVVDTENQWLSSYVRDGATLYTKSLYRYVDGKPVIFQAIDELYSEDDPEGEPEVSLRYPSPDGMKYVREVGNPIGTDVTFEVYDENDEKIGEIAAVRGSIAWVDHSRFVMTRIDGTREFTKEPESGPAFGWRFSVVIFETALNEAIVLNEATDTQNFQCWGEVLEGERAFMVTETFVESKDDWGDEEKEQTREIRVEIPAAG